MAKPQRVYLDEVVAYFDSLEDPRSTINQKHPLVSVVVIALMAVLAGAGGPTAIAKWAKLKAEFLSRVLNLPHGVPGKDVFRRVLSLLKPEAFQRCFAAWLQSLRAQAAEETGVAQPVLAVLSVKDQKFFKQCAPLARTRTLPKVQDAVAVYGFPQGGSDLAVTRGVVSRIQFGRYYQQGMGLMVQVSAAINPGNSGGPAVVGGRMIGLVFSRLAEAENTGYIIPNEEIDRVLENSKDGCYRGQPLENAGTGFHRLENKALRHYLKVDDTVSGVAWSG